MRRLVNALVASGPARPWAGLGSAAAVASLAVAAALQAVDGVALKAMVDRWAAAVEPDHTFIIYGIALLTRPYFRRWLGWFGVIGGDGSACRPTSRSRGPVARRPQSLNRLPFTGTMPPPPEAATCVLRYNPCALSGRTAPSGAHRRRRRGRAWVVRPFTALPRASHLSSVQYSGASSRTHRPQQ